MGDVHELRKFEEGHPATRLVTEPTQQWILYGCQPLPGIDLGVVAEDIISLEGKLETGQLDEAEVVWAAKLVRTVEALTSGM